MKTFGLVAALTLSLSATSAFAAPVITFAGGTGATAAGTTVFQDFESVAPGTPIGAGAFAINGSVPIAGARPAYGSTGNFASVLTGGAYNVSFSPTSLFSFVLGSLDTYNSLTLQFADSSSITYNGGQIIDVANFPSGNQQVPATNGVVSYNVNGGSKIVGAKFNTAGDAFEFDNLAAAAAVPEPATWAMVIAGFGTIGMALRSRRRTTTAFAF